MKNLDVTWLAETVATVSLIIEPQRCAASGSTLEEYAASSKGRLPGKLIVISDGGELRAQVRMLQ